MLSYNWQLCQAHPGPNRAAKVAQREPGRLKEELCGGMGHPVEPAGMMLRGCACKMRLFLRSSSAMSLDLGSLQGAHEPLLVGRILTFLTLQSSILTLQSFTDV